MKLRPGVGWEVGSGDQREEPKGDSHSGPAPCKRSEESQRKAPQAPKARSAQAGYILPAQFPSQGLPSCGVALSQHRSWASKHPGHSQEDPRAPETPPREARQLQNLGLSGRKGWRRGALFCRL